MAFLSNTCSVAHLVQHCSPMKNQHSLMKVRVISRMSFLVPFILQKLFIYFFFCVHMLCT